MNEATLTTKRVLPPVKFRKRRRARLIQRPASRREATKRPPFICTSQHASRARHGDRGGDDSSRFVCRVGCPRLESVLHGWERLRRSSHPGRDVGVLRGPRSERDRFRGDDWVVDVRSDGGTSRVLNELMPARCLTETKPKLKLTFCFPSLR